MRKLAIGLLSFVVLFALAGQIALAAEFIAPDEKSDDVNLAANVSHRNLYVVGRTVNVNSVTTGDLFAAGQNVNVNGSVEADLNAAGQSVIVNASLGGDARLAGASVIVNSTVGGDLLAAGESISVGSGATVGGDVYAAGSKVTIDSPVIGTIKVHADKLTFGPNARVTGSITYRGSEEAVIEDGAQVSTINFTRIEPKDRGLAGVFALGTLIHIVAAFLAALLLIYFARTKVVALLQSNSATPLPNLGIGLAFLILTPIVCVLLFITFVGYYIALILMFAYILLILLGYLVAVLFTGAMLIQLVNKSTHLPATWLSAVVGVIAFEILALIPFVGWLVIFVLWLMGIGSLVRGMWAKRELPPPPVTTEPVVNP
jgi:hypothetical protein